MRRRRANLQRESSLARLTGGAADAVSSGASVDLISAAAAAVAAAAFAAGGVGANLNSAKL